MNHNKRHERTRPITIPPGRCSNGSQPSRYQQHDSVHSIILPTSKRNPECHYLVCEDACHWPPTLTCSASPSTGPRTDWCQQCRTTLSRWRGWTALLAMNEGSLDSGLAQWWTGKRQIVARVLAAVATVTTSGVITLDKRTKTSRDCLYERMWTVRVRDND